MSDARDVIADWLCDAARKNGFEHEHGKSTNDYADAILAALADAGLTPPMPTGRLHKALQDAFQAGFLSAKRDPENFSGLIAKHEYCDAALKQLLEGSE